MTDAPLSAGALFGVLLTQKAIVAVAQSRAHVLHPHDLLLLANLVRSNESFKQAQTFTPVCLPHFNSAAFLHAYVQYLHVVRTPPIIHCVMYIRHAALMLVVSFDQWHCVCVLHNIVLMIPSGLRSCSLRQLLHGRFAFVSQQQIADSA